MHARVMRVRVNHGEVMISMASSVVMIYDCQIDMMGRVYSTILSQVSLARGWFSDGNVNNQLRLQSMLSAIVSVTGYTAVGVLSQQA